MSHVTLPVVAVANATEALIAFAEQGMGIACVPDFTVHRQLADGSLRLIINGCLEYRGSLRAIWPSSRIPSPKLLVFIDFMAKHESARSKFSMDRDAVEHVPAHFGTIASGTASSSAIALAAYRDEINASRSGSAHRSS
jgi:hypothetical protein